MPAQCAAGNCHHHHWQYTRQIGLETSLVGKPETRKSEKIQQQKICLQASKKHLDFCDLVWSKFQYCTFVEPEIAFYTQLLQVNQKQELLQH